MWDVFNKRRSGGVFITAGPSTKLFAWAPGEGGYWRTCATSLRDDEPRPVWTSPSLPITHMCVFITQDLVHVQSVCGFITSVPVSYLLLTLPNNKTA